MAPKNHTISVDIFILSTVLIYLLFSLKNPKVIFYLTLLVSLTSGVDFIISFLADCGDGLAYPMSFVSVCV